MEIAAEQFLHWILVDDAGASNRAAHFGHSTITRVAVVRLEAFLRCREATAVSFAPAGSASALPHPAASDGGLSPLTGCVVATVGLAIVAGDVSRGGNASCGTDGGSGVTDEGNNPSTPEAGPHSLRPCFKTRSVGLSRPEDASCLRSASDIGPFGCLWPP